MDPTSQFIVPTIIDVPELIVTSEDIDFEDSGAYGGGPFGRDGILMNKLQFLSSALTYIIGLGNIWRFPYLCYKHAGGAFLLAYTLILITIGMPILLMELAFGQYANEGPITIWRISPAFEGIGYAMCLVSVTIALYHNFINAWILHYLMASITFGPLPWTNCENQWNSELCFYKPDIFIKGTYNNCTGLNVTNNNIPVNETQITRIDNANLTVARLPVSQSSNTSILLVPGNCTAQQQANSSMPFSFDKIINTTDEVILPSNEYFHNNVMQITPSPNQIGGLNWHLFFGIVIVWSSVFIILLKNLHRPLSNNQPFALIALVMPYLSLFALFTRAVTLPGASIGLQYFFTIDWHRLQNIDIWTDATTQLFFAMSPCWGGIITLANMNKFHNNFHANTMLIIGMNYITSILMGLVTFGILGYMTKYSGIAINEVVDSGVGFIFQVLPEGINQFPFAKINAILIFSILLFIGLASQITTIETAITTIIDTWPHKLRYRRPLVLMILCTSMVLISFFMSFRNSFYLIQSIMDSFAGTISGMIIGILELIAIAWVYGVDNFIQDIDDMISVHRNLFPSRTYWYFMWRYLTPSVLFAILFFSIIDFSPTAYRQTETVGWTSSLGWTLTLATVALIPMIAFVRFLLTPQGSFSDKISYLCRPSEDWAPSSYVSGPKLINRHEMLNDSDLALNSGDLRSSNHHISGSSRNDDSDDAINTTQGETTTMIGTKLKGRSWCKDNGVGTTYAKGRKRIPASGVYRDEVEYVDDEDDNENDDGDDDDCANSDCNDLDSEDLKVVNGKANYIIPEEEDDTDTGLITSETNV